MMKSCHDFHSLIELAAWITSLSLSCTTDGTPGALKVLVWLKVRMVFFLACVQVFVQTDFAVL